ncbi:MAG: hypothetical protein LBT62_01130 [Deltaproteobacteria bacterium]|nr:hypothetical protein [Deltaproteobacteria bacterium]
MKIHAPSAKDSMVFSWSSHVGASTAKLGAASPDLTTDVLSLTFTIYGKSRYLDFRGALCFRFIFMR